MLPTALPSTSFLIVMLPLSCDEGTCKVPLLPSFTESKAVSVAALFARDDCEENGAVDVAFSLLGTVWSSLGTGYFGVPALTTTVP